MGCVNSKKAVAGDNSSPPPQPPLPSQLRSSSRNRSNVSSRHKNTVAEPVVVAEAAAVAVMTSRGGSNSEAAVSERKESEAKLEERVIENEGSMRAKGSLNMRVGISYRFVEAEQNAVGWPPWLTSLAGEAIQGWVPLKTGSYEKLDKIGEGTYSSVFQAREIETGRIVALKKVRFNTFQPESIRFMAREIIILRALDHPNIMKLEGIITSHLSNSIYLVFEYMEHDLAGLLSSPNIKFSDSQIKCYMRQLLSGIEHCHLRGIMHRDIKVSNILVNNEGVLKIGDFGLANAVSPNNKHPLTSRVVTLWYRPPELLMGSTQYGVSVDLWSVGCVFAELFLGKPILKGRTEVEQLHKIFKLCGSPPAEFWKKCKLPLARMFKPQTNYESTFQERCNGLPVTAVNLIETLLSIDPYKRGTASSALISEYFNTEPYACSPSILPKYPPSKEMDAKIREDAHRKKNGGKVGEAVTSRKQRQAYKFLQDPNNYSKPAIKEEMQNISQNASKNDGKTHLTKGKVGSTHQSHQLNRLYSGPAPVTGSSGFTWTKRRKPAASSTLSDSSRSKISALDPTFAKGTYDLTKHGIDVSKRKYSSSSRRQDENSKHVVHKNPDRHDRRGSFDSADTYHSNHYLDFIPTQKTDTQVSSEGHRKHGEPMEQSVPMVIQENKNDDLFHWDENTMRRSVRRSRFGRDK
ncbi:hypothetical protein Lal_00036681 [Lupinus albus]|uniref:Uncharacterized protein n=1 Tax=Lupinus albus TaxID=3870 RepID=A0A6A5NVL6_LUPAL|nr:putative protein-serine/threonine kinase CMGC-CDK-CRK7-CDK9 family [Lupinus albus]KAF1888642.1 hypothetical protein Lal_00036681 [Lupinus albus]